MSEQRWTPAEQAVLAARTRALAAPVAEERAVTEPALVIAMGKERCALPLGFVQGVVRLAHLTRLPGVGSYVAGLFAHQGEVLVAFHLHALFDVTLAALPEYARAVLVGRDAPEAGLVVEHIDGIVELELDTLGEVPPELSDRTRRFLSGVDPDGIPVVDGAALLDSDALHVSRAGPDFRGHR